MSTSAQKIFTESYSMSTVVENGKALLKGWSEVCLEGTY